MSAVANNRNIWNNLRDALPSPYTVIDALEWIAQVTSQHPVINFAIVCDGMVVGSIGCEPKEDISRNNIEIGYFVGEPYWGKGVATEAVKHILSFIATKLHVVRVEAHVFARNKFSMKVLQKNGFYLEAIHRKAVVKNNEILDDHVWVKFL